MMPKPQNNYGTIMSDLIKPFYIRTQEFQYRHSAPCLQNQSNLHQTNYRDLPLPHPELVDLESELRNITRVYSRLPADRYAGYCRGSNKSNVPVCLNKPIMAGCTPGDKIVPKKYYSGEPSPTHANVAPADKLMKMFE